MPRQAWRHAAQPCTSPRSRGTAVARAAPPVRRRPSPPPTHIHERDQQRQDDCGAGVGRGQGSGVRLWRSGGAARVLKVGDQAVEEAALGALRHRFDQRRPSKPAPRQITAKSVELQHAVDLDLRERRRQTDEVSLLFCRYAQRLYGEGREAYLAIEAGRTSPSITPRIDAGNSRGINHMVAGMGRTTVTSRTSREPHAAVNRASSHGCPGGRGSGAPRPGAPGRRVEALGGRRGTSGRPGRGRPRMSKCGRVSVPAIAPTIVSVVSRRRTLVQPRYAGRHVLVSGLMTSLSTAGHIGPVLEPLPRCVDVNGHRAQPPRRRQLPRREQDRKPASAFPVRQGEQLDFALALENVEGHEVGE